MIRSSLHRSAGNAAPGAAFHAWSLRFAPVMLLPVAAVLVASACVLWFMNAAIRNEGLAMRQKLSDVYLGRITEYRSRVDRNLEMRFSAAAAFRHLQARETFSGIVTASLADSVIIPGSKEVSAYPLIADAATPQENADSEYSFSYMEALDLEYGLDSPSEAAAVYAELAASAQTPDEAALALRDQIRCLIRAGQTKEALRILKSFRNNSNFQQCRDELGRLVRANMLLLEMQLANEADIAALAAELAKLAGDYTVVMPSAQRAFLMSVLVEISQEELPDILPDIKKLLRGEQLAESYLASSAAAASSGVVSRDAATGLFHVAVADGAMILLYEKLPVDFEALCGAVVQEESVLCSIKSSSDAGSFVRGPLSNLVRDYVVAVELEGDNPLAVAANRQRMIYMWIGGLGIFAIAALTGLVARYLARQMKLTRLKNDLIATVSHELKTPLASMRLLIDTLQEGRTTDERQVREYFHMIARENERLTRLIDNFLTFSRMERNKQVMRFAPVAASDIIDAAMESVSDRYDGQLSRIEVDLPDELTEIRGDRDSLITVLVNLLDNAWKYSGDEKVVRLRVWQQGDSVCIEVADNGIGMTRGQLRRVFERFYQADNSLSRTVGGCGLGLSIVKFIVDMHGGTIDAASQSGKGSVFTLKLPGCSVAKDFGSEYGQ